jgi:hypothetical protein
VRVDVELKGGRRPFAESYFVQKSVQKEFGPIYIVAIVPPPIDATWVWENSCSMRSKIKPLEILPLTLHAHSSADFLPHHQYARAAHGLEFDCQFPSRLSRKSHIERITLAFFARVMVEQVDQGEMVREIVAA